jgi:phosphoglycolate phosphatase
MRYLENSMPDIQSLVFDLDGTLIDSAYDIASSINFVRKTRYLPELQLEAVRSNPGDGAEQLVKRCFPESTGEEHDVILPAFREHYRMHCCEKTRAFPGVMDTLERLKSRYRMAVLTNKDHAISLLILETLGLLAYFELVVGGDGPCLKPCPEGLLSIAQALKTKPEHMAMIGDHHTDLETGRRSGVRTIFCEYGYGNRGSERPDAVIAQFSDLLSVLPELTGDIRKRAAQT